VGEATGEAGAGSRHAVAGGTGAEDQVVALLVVAYPLFIALAVPTAAALVSSGLVRSRPEYSWI
jgi:hypothetical protein